LSECSQFRRTLISNLRERMFLLNRLLDTTRFIDFDEVKVASRDFEQEMRQRMRQENVNEIKIASRDFRQRNVNVFRFDERNVSLLF
jgi:hypothetical protein